MFVFWYVKKEAIVMKLNRASQTHKNSSLLPKFTLSPALLTGLMAAALPSVVSAQAREARGNYSPPTVSRPAAPSPTFSRPNYTPSAPSFQSPSFSSPQAGAGMRTAPTVTSPGQSSLGNNTSLGTTLFYQANPTNGQTTRTQMPGSGTTRTPGGSIIYGGRPGQTTTQMPTTRIVNTNPGAINGIITNPNSSYNRFNNSAEARRFRFGVPNHGRYYYGNYGGFGYFPGSLAYSPYYSPYYSFGYTALSPYAFYYGAYPPFITLGSVYAEPPQYVYVPYPVYQDGAYNGYRSDDVDGYYLNRNNAQDGGYRVGENARKSVKEAVKDPLLDATIADIQNAWKTSKLDTLAKHVRRDARVAVYLRGKYQYSLDAGDYLDMTRDALAATKTSSFELNNVQRKQKDVYTVTGRHVYRDKDDNEHTVFITYVLEKSEADYIITQVGSAPEKVEE